MMLAIVTGILGIIAGYCFAIEKDECPAMIMGYKCKGYNCNHSKFEVDRAREQMRNRQPPTKFNFRP